MDNKANFNKEEIAAFICSFLTVFFGFCIVIDSSLVSSIICLTLSCVTFVIAMYYLYRLQSATNSDTVTDFDVAEDMIYGWGLRIQKNRLIRLLCLMMPTFPFIYILAALKILDSDYTLLGFIISNILVKVLYVTILINSHAEVVKRMYLSESCANSTRRMFLKYFMHEVSTPLSSVSTGLGVMAHYMLDEGAKDTVEMMKSATEFMTDSLNNMLSMQLIEEGNFKLKMAPFILSDVLAKATTSVRNMHRNKDIELDISVASDVPITIIGDRDRIENVLSCLLNNAYKRSSNLCCVRIIVSISKKRSQNNIDLQFSVTDDAAGLTEKQMSALFHPFQQLNSHDLERDGTAFGLHICRKIVTLHGGSLHVECDPNNGNVFSFTVTCCGESKRLIVTPEVFCDEIHPSSINFRCDEDGNSSDKHTFRHTDNKDSEDTKIDSHPKKKLSRSLGILKSSDNLIKLSSKITPVGNVLLVDGK